MSPTLCFAGVLLFAIGLANGLVIPALKSPRLGLSAHLTGVQSGTMLLGTGFLWPHLTLWDGWSAPLAHAMWISFYVIWFGMFLSGLWGTGRTLSIAGAGIQAAPWQEQTVRIVLAVSSIALFLVFVAVLIQWRWSA